MEEGLSFRDTALAIVSFLEVAIHTILRIRQIYPPELFVRRRKYNAPVYQSRHPELNQYIADAVNAVSEEVVLGTVDKVIVVIKDQQDRALERFIFSLQNILTLSPEEVDTPISDTLSIETIEQYFRAFLIKLSMADAQLGDMKDTSNLTFSILIETHQDTTPHAPDEDEPTPWVPATKEYVSDNSMNEAQLHVIKALETGVINMSLVVQESAEKFKRESQRVPPHLSKGKGKGKEKMPA